MILCSDSEFEQNCHVLSRFVIPGNQTPQCTSKTTLGILFEVSICFAEWYSKVYYKHYLNILGYENSLGNYHLVEEPVMNSKKALHRLSRTFPWLQDHYSWFSMGEIISERSAGAWRARRAWLGAVLSIKSESKHGTSKYCHASIAHYWEWKSFH